jgi:hypothetical protein
MTDFKQLHIQVKSSMVQTNSMTSNHIGVVVIIISSSIISIIIIIPNRCRVQKMWNSSPQRTCTWCKLDLECLCSFWALFLPWKSGVHQTRAWPNYWDWVTWDEVHQNWQYDVGFSEPAEWNMFGTDWPKCGCLPTKNGNISGSWDLKLPETQSWAPGSAWRCFG